MKERKSVKTNNKLMNCEKKKIIKKIKSIDYRKYLNKKENLI